MTDRLADHVQKHKNLALFAHSLAERARTVQHETQQVCQQVGIELATNSEDNQERTFEQICLFTGSNSAGKSALINILLQRKILPMGAGNVTGRILKLKYAEMQNSCIYLEDENGQVANSITSLAGDKSDADLAEIIGTYANRPGHEVENWCTFIVVVEYPIPILNSGIVIVDSPGFNESDNNRIQEVTKNFIKIHRPTISFVYSNAAFANAEIIALDILISLFPRETFPPILFISTYLSISGIAKNWRRATEPFTAALEREHEHRYQLLASALETKQLSMFLTRENFVSIDSPNVSKYIMRDAGVTPLMQSCSKDVYEYFCTHMGASIMRVMSTSLREICENILCDISTFNTAMNSAVNLDNEAREYVIELTEFEGVIMKIIEGAMQHFKLLFLAHIEGGSLADFAFPPSQNCSMSHMSRANLENALLDRLNQLGDRPRTGMQTITNYLENTFSRHAERLYNECLTELADIVYHKFGEVFASLHNVGIVVRYLFQSVLQQSSLRRRQAKYPRFLPRFMGGPIYDLFEKFANWFQRNNTLTMDQKVETVRDVMNQFVESVKEMDEAVLLPEETREIFRNIGRLTVMRVRAGADQVAKMQRAPALLNLTPKYAELTACTLALNDYLKNPTLKEADAHLPSCGSMSDVYHVKLSDRLILKRVAVEMLSRHGFNEVHLLFWARQNNSQHVIKLERVQFSCSSQNAPPVGIDMGTLQSVDDLFKLPHLFVDLVLERFDSDLQSYLSDCAVFSEHNIRACLRMMKAIALGVSELHAINVIHRDLCLRNILIRRNTIVVADLGVSTALVARTVCGDWMHAAPEIDQLQHGDTYTSKVDIFSLGLLFAELLPKPQFIQIPCRDYHTRKMIDLTPIIASFNAPDDLTRLIISMISIDPDARPSITKVISSLNSVGI